jgi:hypothetical protein
LLRQAVDDIRDYFFLKTVDPDPDDEPLGRVIVGPKGFGKTHLIGELRRQVWEREGWFILLDFIGIKDFWSSVALGFLFLRASASLSPAPTSKRRIVPTERILRDQLRVPAGVTRSRSPGTAPSTSSSTFVGSGLRLATWADDNLVDRI